MPRPLLSVILPTFNGAERLVPVLDRLRAEIAAAGVPAEVIAVDDRSTDGTAGLLARTAADWPLLRSIAGEGRGPGAARNAALGAARGSLVAFADDDDLWTGGRLAAQIAAHRTHPDAVLSLTDYAHVREDAPDARLPSAFSYWPLWRRFRGRGPVRIGDARPLIAAENAVGTSTVMVRRDACLAVGGFDETLASASDWDLWLRLAGRGPVLVLGIEGARYAMRPGSVSARRGARVAAMRQILARHPDLPRWSRRRAEARIATALSEAAAERGDRRAAFAHALAALLRRPGGAQARRCLGLARRLA